MSLLVKKKSAINVINKKGPKIDPCGTPKVYRKILLIRPGCIYGQRTNLMDLYS